MTVLGGLLIVTGVTQLSKAARSSLGGDDDRCRRVEVVEIVETQAGTRAQRHETEHWEAELDQIDDIIEREVERAAREVERAEREVERAAREMERAERHRQGITVHVN